MSQYKHLSLDERKTIEEQLNRNESFSSIARRISRNRNSISREVLRNFTVKRSGTMGAPFNNCLKRKECVQYRLCSKEDCKRQTCKGCSFCFRLCPDFEREPCPLLTSAPYVCNGCNKRHKCTLEKFIYQAGYAHKSYEQTRQKSREGVSITVNEILRIDKILSPLLKQGHSIYSVLQNHKDEIMLDETTIYRYVKLGLFDAKVTDLLNVVKMKPRHKKATVKVERACKTGRTYRDFLNFIEENPDTPVVQMDSVIGKKGYDEPVLLTMHFVQEQLMLAFKREANTAKSVTEIIDSLYKILGHETFTELFPVILTDNGSEFSNPSAIEKDENGVTRAKVFFTDTSSPFQKGACENNHSLIRRIIPKGTSFKMYSQEDISLLMNNINSYKRKKLRGFSPIETFNFFHDSLILKKLGIISIPQDSINLKPELLK